jgi:hypothetical protein
VIAAAARALLAVGRRFPGVRFLTVPVVARLVDELDRRAATPPPPPGVDPRPN